jgi:DUF4097 and DUF4098 domain-containing protein YvlB
MHMTRITTCLLTVLLAAFPAFAQQHDNQNRDMNCDNNRRNNNDRASHCEIQEQTLAAAPQIRVDGGMNGGASVKGWSRKDILVRYKIETQADSDAEAQALARQVHVSTSGGSIHADGPSSYRRMSWGVSYEVFVPWHTDVDVKTHNGGVNIADVNGHITFDALNGGAHLTRLAGRVDGHTTNGGLSIELAGNRWEGGELNAETTNGGVHLSVPDGYSAQLETGTVNGHINIDFPVTVQGDIRRHMSVTLGSGGPRVRAVTTNGGVTIKRATV